MSQDEEKLGFPGVGVGGQSPGYHPPPLGQNSGFGPQQPDPVTPPVWFRKYAETTENLMGHVEKLATRNYEIQKGLEDLGEATRVHLSQVEGKTATQLGGILPQVNGMVEQVVAKMTEESEKRQAALLQKIGQLGILPQPENIAKMLQFSENFEEKLQRSLAAMDSRLAKMQQASENFARSTEGLEKKVENVRAETRIAFEQVRAKNAAQENIFRQTQEAFQKSVDEVRSENQAGLRGLRTEVAAQDHFFSKYL